MTHPGPWPGVDGFRQGTTKGVLPIIVPIASYRYYKKREVIIENRFFLQYILPHSIVLLKSLEVLRTGDVQEILGVGRKEVYRLIADGALPAVRAGRGYRILKAALVEWLGAEETCG